MKNILLIISLFLSGCVTTKDLSVSEYKIYNKNGVYRIFDGKKNLGQIVKNNSAWVDGSSYMDQNYSIRSTSIMGVMDQNTLEIYDQDGPIGSIQNISYLDKENIIVIKDYLSNKIYRSEGMYRGNRMSGYISILDIDDNRVLSIKYYGNDRWMILKYGDINPDIFLHVIRFSGSHPLL